MSVKSTEVSFRSVSGTEESVPKTCLLPVLSSQLPPNSSTVTNMDSPIGFMTASKMKFLSELPDELIADENDTSDSRDTSTKERNTFILEHDSDFDESEDVLSEDQDKINLLNNVEGIMGCEVLKSDDHSSPLKKRRSEMMAEDSDECNDAGGSSSDFKFHLHIPKKKKIDFNLSVSFNSASENCLLSGMFDDKEKMDTTHMARDLKESIDIGMSNISSGKETFVIPRYLDGKFDDVDLEKANMLCHHLLLLFHTYSCIRNNSRLLSHSSCEIPNCNHFKMVLSHMWNCSKMEGCKVPHCLSSKMILSHWKYCSRESCPICSNSEVIKVSASNMNIPVKVIINTEQNLSVMSEKADQKSLESSHKVFETLPNLSLPIKENNVTSESEIPRQEVDDGITISLTTNKNIALVANDYSVMDTSAPLIVKHEEPLQTQFQVKSEDVTMIKSTSDEKVEDTIIDSLHHSSCYVLVKSTTDGTVKQIWHQNKLFEMFNPILSLIVRQDPDVKPFLHPVNAIEENVPDYYEIIRKPMDLSTIKLKLTSGDYKNPWDCVSDFWQMFNNAWIYNKKNTKVYKSALKLSMVFEEAAKKVMVENQFCCAKTYCFTPRALYCEAKDYCVIPRDSWYYGYGERNICCKCFDEYRQNTVPVNDEDSGQQKFVDKKLFQKLKNDKIEYEPFVTCTECGIILHEICVLHLNVIHGKLYRCDNCLLRKKLVKIENQFTASKLPVSHLSEYIEKRVNNFLKKQHAPVQYVHVRMVANVDKATETKTNFLKKYGPENFPTHFPYRSKALFAFEEIDGVDVCFFGMHVQEYGNDCPEPNRNRVYLSYLDSVHYFQPKFLRTAVYHEILLSYFDFCLKRGFQYLHIWSCAPCEGDDYVFHCHPPEQKVPKRKRLCEWYKTLISKGINGNVFLEFTDMHRYVCDEIESKPERVPVFDGDYWPRMLEDAISELEKEEAEFNSRMNSQNGGSRSQSASAGDTATMESCNLAKLDKNSDMLSKNARSKKAKRNKNSKKKSTSTDGVLTLSQRLVNFADRYREDFFVVKLNSPLKGSTEDLDPLMPCDMMDGRSGFLNISCERNWEYSSLRRAKYSTIGMLMELHTGFGDKYLFNCNRCECKLDGRLHCTVCSDFDLCKRCQKEIGHEHELKEISPSQGLSFLTEAMKSSSMVVAVGGMDPTNQRSAMEISSANVANLLSGSSGMGENICSILSGDAESYNTSQVGSVYQQTSGMINSGMSFASNVSGIRSAGDTMNTNVSSVLNHPFKQLPSHGLPNAGRTQPQKTGRVSSVELFSTLEHSVLCSVVPPEECSVTSCYMLKAVISHFRDCIQQSSVVNCARCKLIIPFINSHSRICKNNRCKVPLCENMKERIRINYHRERHDQELLVRRRAAIMQMQQQSNRMPTSVTPVACGGVNSNHPSMPQSSIVLSTGSSAGYHLQSNQALLNNHSMISARSSTPYQHGNVKNSPHSPNLSQQTHANSSAQGGVYYDESHPLLICDNQNVTGSVIGGEISHSSTSQQNEAVMTLSGGTQHHFPNNNNNIGMKSQYNINDPSIGGTELVGGMSLMSSMSMMNNDQISAINDQRGAGSIPMMMSQTPVNCNSQNIPQHPGSHQIRGRQSPNHHSNVGVGNFIQHPSNHHPGMAPISQFSQHQAMLLQQMASTGGSRIRSGISPQMHQLLSAHQQSHLLAANLQNIQQQSHQKNIHHQILMNQLNQKIVNGEVIPGSQHHQMILSAIEAKVNSIAASYNSSGPPVGGPHHQQMYVADKMQMIQSAASHPRSMFNFNPANGGNQQLGSNILMNAPVNQQNYAHEPHHPNVYQQHMTSANQPQQSPLALQNRQTPNFIDSASSMPQMNPNSQQLQCINIPGAMINSVDGSSFVSAQSSLINNPHNSSAIAAVMRQQQLRTRNAVAASSIRQQMLVNNTSLPGAGTSAPLLQQQQQLQIDGQSIANDMTNIQQAASVPAIVNPQNIQIPAGMMHYISQTQAMNHLIPDSSSGQTLANDVIMQLSNALNVLKPNNNGNYSNYKLGICLVARNSFLLSTLPKELQFSLLTLIASVPPVKSGNPAASIPENSQLIKLANILFNHYQKLFTTLMNNQSQTPQMPIHRRIPSNSSTTPTAPGIFYDSNSQQSQMMAAMPGPPGLTSNSPIVFHGVNNPVLQANIGVQNQIPNMASESQFHPNSQNLNNPAACGSNSEINNVHQLSSIFNEPHEHANQILQQGIAGCSRSIHIDISQNHTYVATSNGSGSGLNQQFPNQQSTHHHIQKHHLGPNYSPSSMLQNPNSRMLITHNMLQQTGQASQEESRQQLQSHINAAATVAAAQQSHMANLNETLSQNWGRHQIQQMQAGSNSNGLSQNLRQANNSHQQQSQGQGEFSESSSPSHQTPTSMKQNALVDSQILSQMSQGIPINGQIHRTHVHPSMVPVNSSNDSENEPTMLLHQSPVRITPISLNRQQNATINANGQGSYSMYTPAAGNASDHNNMLYHSTTNFRNTDQKLSEHACLNQLNGLTHSLAGIQSRSVSPTSMNSTNVMNPNDHNYIQHQQVYMNYTQSASAISQPNAQHASNMPFMSGNQQNNLRLRVSHQELMAIQKNNLLANAALAARRSNINGISLNQPVSQNMFADGIVFNSRISPNGNSIIDSSTNNASGHSFGDFSEITGSGNHPTSLGVAGVNEEVESIMGKYNISDIPDIISSNPGSRINIGNIGSVRPPSHLDKDPETS